MAREAWTDERLDDLNGRVSEGFARLDTDIRELRGEMSRGFTELRDEMNGGLTGLRGEMNGGFTELRRKRTICAGK